MKIETYKPKKEPNKISHQLMALLPGQALRLKTANEYRNLGGAISALKRRTGKQVCTKSDGDDVLVFLKP